MEVNEKIGLKDIIGLAMKGYKPSDIKELVSIAASVQKVDDQGSEEGTDDNEGQAKSEPSETSSDEETKTTPAEDQNTIKLQDELNKLREKIKTLQAENTKKDLQGEVKSDQEKFEELVKNFY